MFAKDKIWHMSWHVYDMVWPVFKVQGECNPDGLTSCGWLRTSLATQVHGVLWADWADWAVLTLHLSEGELLEHSLGC